MRPGTTVQVLVRRLCDLCEAQGETVTAYADARLPFIGGWANVCPDHFIEYGCSLGTGRGQRFIYPPPPGAEPVDHRGRSQDCLPFCLGGWHESDCAKVQEEQP